LKINDRLKTEKNALANYVCLKFGEDIHIFSLVKNEGFTYCVIGSKQCMLNMKYV